MDPVSFQKSSPLCVQPTISANVSHRPPVLLLADLYPQALTIGNCEFFGSSSSSSSSRSVRNPLTLDELVSFSKQLMNIAFMMLLAR